MADGYSLLHRKRRLNPACRIRRDPNIVGPRRNDPMHFRIVRAQIISFHSKLYSFVFARIKRDTLKSFQLTYRSRSGRNPITHVQLHNLGGLALPNVLNLGAHMQSAILRNRCIALQIAVLEFRISEPIAERKQRLLTEIEISCFPAVGRGWPSSVFVIVVNRNLSDGSRPAQWQSATGRSISKQGLGNCISCLTSQIPCLDDRRHTVQCPTYVER